MSSEDEEANEVEYPINDTMLEAIQNVMTAQIRALRNDFRSQIDELKAAPDKRQRRDNDLITGQERADQPAPVPVLLASGTEQVSAQQTANRPMPATQATISYAQAAAHQICNMTAGHTTNTSILNNAQTDAIPPASNPRPYTASFPTSGILEGTHAPPPMGESTEDDTVEDSTQVISNLLTAAGSALGKKKGKTSLIPHNYVIRGDNKDRVAMGDASIAEYIAALCRMTKDPKLPVNWRENIYEHIHQLSIMASTWEWATCRLWSERIFSMMDDGRLPNAWAEVFAIRDVQRDAITVGTRIGGNGQAQTCSFRHATIAPQPQQQQQQQQASNTNYDYKTEFNREVDGKPCIPWNWGNECGFAASHGQMPDRRAHVCAWCANKYHRANGHQEKNCINKRRFLERKNTQPTATTTTASGAEQQQPPQVFQ